MFRSKEINLSESVVQAIEGLKQALEVLYGAEVRFVGPMSIEPGKIRCTQIRRKELPDNTMESRSVSGEVNFKGCLPGTFHLAEPRSVTFTADLTKYGEVWKLGVMSWVQRSEHYQEDRRGTWYVAQWEYDTPAFPKVRVIQQGGGASENPEWRIGYGAASVSTEPLFA